MRCRTRAPSGGLRSTGTSSFACSTWNNLGGPRLGFLGKSCPPAHRLTLPYPAPGPHLGDPPNGETMKIACLLGQGFEDSEFRVPYDRLLKEGYQVDVIGLKAGEELKGYKGKEKVKAEKAIDGVRPDDYDALIIPGGQSPDHLRADKRVIDFVRAFDASGKLVAA